MTDAQEALVDVQWLKREAAHCRRMDYAEPAERYERIAAALNLPGVE